MPDEGLAKLLGAMERAVGIAEKFDKARAGRNPYAADALCTICRKPGVFLHYRYNGPRAVRMWCDTPACVRLMS